MDTTKYHTVVDDKALSAWDETTASRIYQQVFRTDFESPGVALISFRQPVSSQELRLAMWNLKQALDTLHHQANGKHLIYLSAGRFDSQVTTKFHLDGAPDEAFLMLGYEASPVHSELSIADYSKAAFDWGITPQALLADFNPMIPSNEQRLLPYAAKLAAFNSSQSHILLLNNSSLPFSADEHGFLGVMHQATIVRNPQSRRIINSTMISTAETVGNEPVSPEMIRHFLATDEITEY